MSTNIAYGAALCALMIAFLRRRSAEKAADHPEASISAPQPHRNGKPAEESYAGKVVLVTGGSGGIGRAICLRMAEAGAHVAVHYNSQPRLAEETVALCLAAGAASAKSFQAKLGDAEGIESRRLVEAVLAEYGTIHVLVNNVSRIQQLDL
jgi:NADPH:quinone reductase-like Zn-dependent oxidoreductase